MDGAAIVFNWSFLGALVVAVGLSLTLGKRTWLLFWIVGLVVAGVLAAEAFRTSRKGRAT